MKCVSQGGEWSGRGYPGTVGTPASHLVSADPTRRSRLTESAHCVVKRPPCLCGASPRHHPAHTAPHLDTRLRWPLDPRKGRRCHTALGPAGTPTRPCPGHNELALDSGLQVPCARILFAHAAPVGCRSPACESIWICCPGFPGRGLPPSVGVPRLLRAGRLRRWRWSRSLRRPFADTHA